MSLPICVGYDGSDSCLPAVRWAAKEALIRRRPLEILYAFPVAPIGGGRDASMLWPESRDLTHYDAQRMLDEVLERVGKVNPGIDVTSKLLDSVNPAATLISRSRRSELMVVGSRGRGGFAGLLLGSTSTRLATRGHCPVVVVREHDATGPHAGQVVVGVDTSPRSTPVLDFGFAEAAAAGVDLVAVHAWEYPWNLATTDVAVVVLDVEEAAAREEQMLSEALAGYQERYPNVNVVRRLERGLPRTVLRELSAGAHLLAVGSRGHGQLAGMVLGSVSMSLLLHARAPVVVLRQRDDD
ncbi:MAG TPA: universal stress protein [Stackebrandtia sp.]|jgi:nucleotide-binding universal stress UspA family protein|uniref:universal stress protein n=1 Tax=Stackebrandtia sp. TaxID=2023065 RepID=UPI002D229349|nr:universal stress protein [Stackebrandtia sp.]HZE41725.1 universal stress protein [Stackebrandtia sp.]